MPRPLQVPKCDRATASDHRSAAQKGQDSSLTNTMAGLPSTVSGGPAERTFCSGVATWPGLMVASVLAGTVVTCRTTLAGAADSRPLWCADPAVSLTATSTAKTASTAVI